MKTLKEFKELNESSVENDRSTYLDDAENISRKIETMFRDKPFGISDTPGLEEKFDANMTPMIKDMLSLQAKQKKVWNTYIKKQAKLLGWSLSSSSTL